jgi:hypothetical protein
VLRLAISVLAALALVGPAFSAPPKKKPQAKTTPTPVDPFIKSTVWTGKVAAIDVTSIAVTSDKALTRKFSIHPGTILGRGGSAKLADFKVGDPVVVSFSEVHGSTVAKAENISPPKAPRAGQRKRKGAAKKP